jgi:Cyanate permease
MKELKNSQNTALYQKSKYRKYMLLTAILLLGVLDQAPAVVNSTIPAMTKSFSGHSLALIESITTVTNMFVTVFVLISGFLVNKIGQKQTAIIGIVIAAVASIVPVFSNDFYIVLGSRAVLGVGIGLSNALAASLLSAFFQGNELAKYMGFRTAAGGVGTSLMTMVAGQLLKVSWHFSYLVYILFIPTLLLFIFYVPEPEKYGIYAQKKSEEKYKAVSDNAKGSKFAGLGTVLALALLFFFFLVGATIFGIKLAQIFVSQGIGTASEASVISSVFTLSQMFGGMLFGYCYKHFGKKMLPVTILLRGLPLLVISIASSKILIGLMAVVFGFAGGMTVSLIFMIVNTVINPKNATLYNAIPMIGSNMGAFCAPFIARYMGNTPSIAMRNAGWMYEIMAVIILVIFILASARKQENYEQKEDKYASR